MLFKKKIEPEDEPVEPIVMVSPNQQILADVDKLKSSVGALKEVKDFTHERFSRISEEIGEIRSMLIDREKEIEEVSTKIIKVDAIVEELEPERILSDLKGYDSKLDVMQAKQEEMQKMLQEQGETLKKLNSLVETFRGVDQALKIYKDVRERIKDYEKLEDDTKRHADKVEEIYASSQRLLNQITEINEYISKNKLSQKEFNDSFNELKLKVLKYVEREEMEELKTIIARQENDWNEKINELKSLKQDVMLVNDEIKQNISTLDSETKMLKINIKDNIHEEFESQRESLKREIMEGVQLDHTTKFVNEEIQYRKQNIKESEEFKRLVSIVDILIKSGSEDEARKLYIDLSRIYDKLPLDIKKKSYTKMEEFYQKLK